MAFIWFVQKMACDVVMVVSLTTLAEEHRFPLESFYPPPKQLSPEKRSIQFAAVSNLITM